MASALTDAAWAEICAAAARVKLTPDAEARAVLSAILFEQYPAFAYTRDRARAETTVKRAERMLKHLNALEADYRECPSPDAVKAEAHLWGMGLLRNYVEAMRWGAWTIRQANARHANEQRMLLYHWLCTVWLEWLEHFHAEHSGDTTSPGYSDRLLALHRMTYSRPASGKPRKPYGPLIDFMFTAMRQIIPEDELPSHETVRDFIDDYRAGRKKLLEEIRKRMVD